jgi:hypothetical protein
VSGGLLSDGDQHGELASPFSLLFPFDADSLLGWTLVAVQQSDWEPCAFTLWASSRCFHRDFMVAKCVAPASVWPHVRDCDERPSSTRGCIFLDRLYRRGS